MNILITGGTGFIGSYLVKMLLEQGHNITILSRNQRKAQSNIRFIGHVSEISDNETIEAIINLAGANISKRWTQAYKDELISSRVTITKSIIALISRLIKKPDLFISASAIGYYGIPQQNDIALDEQSKYTDGFTHQLCAQSEEEALKAKIYGVRTCIARLGVVLGKNGGALEKMLPAFKFCLGGQIGSGAQFFSWIHIKDVLLVFYEFIKNKEYNGIYNVTSPNPITNSEFTAALSRALKRPAILPVPAFIIKLIFGEMGENLLLNGQKVIPKRLEQNSFEFSYPTIYLALLEIVSDPL